MVKGTKENPYSYDEYLELAKENEWTGGYVRMYDGIVKWVPAQETEGTGGNGCGSGTGSGEGSGSGSGSGSNDKPQYMVRGGQVTQDTPQQPFDSITIFWTGGIALPHAACGSANKDGFYSDVSYELINRKKNLEITHVDCRYDSAYNIYIEILWKTPRTRFEKEASGTFDTSYSIPDIYHEDF